MAKLFMKFAQKSASSATCCNEIVGTNHNRVPYEIFVLSNLQMELIFSYLDYQELTVVRSVCQWFYHVVGAIMNRKFKSLRKEVEFELSTEKNEMSPSESRLKVLTVLASEIKMLESHCLEYITGSMFYFYGGVILDYVDLILDNRKRKDVMTDISELFMLIDYFLNTFDSVTEPILLGRSYHLPFSWFGRKLLDVLDCYSSLEHLVAIEPLQSGCHIKWTGKYSAVPVRSLLPPPSLGDSTEGNKTDMDAALKFVRNHVRWNNILDIIESSHNQPKRFEKRIHLEENGARQSSESWKQRIISEKCRIGENEVADPRRFEISIGLLSHELFAPSRYKELRDLLSNLRRNPSEEDEPSKSDDVDNSSSVDPLPPQKHDYELDLTMEITHKEDGIGKNSYRTTTIQICHIDNACYIASNTTAAGE